MDSMIFLLLTAIVGFYLLITGRRSHNPWVNLIFGILKAISIVVFFLFYVTIAIARRYGKRRKY